MTHAKDGYSDSGRIRSHDYRGRYSTFPHDIVGHAAPALHLINKVLHTLQCPVIESEQVRINTGVREENPFSSNLFIATLESII